MARPPRVIKVLVVGNSTVDKGLLLSKFENSERRDYSFVSTIGLSCCLTIIPLVLSIPFRVRDVNVDGQTVRLQLWDAGWTEAWAAVDASSHDARAASALLLVYDVTREDTYESVRMWLQRVKSAGRCTDRVVMMVLGDNCHFQRDDRQVTWERGKELGREGRVAFLEVSSVTAANLETALKSVARAVLAKESAAAHQSSSNDRSTCSLQ
ncbi:ras-related protein Rab-8B-like isoform X1 [Scylla paramamosain]